MNSTKMNAAVGSLAVGRTRTAVFFTLGGDRVQERQSRQCDLKSIACRSPYLEAQSLSKHDRGFDWMELNVCCFAAVRRTSQNPVEIEAILRYKVAQMSVK